MRLINKETLASFEDFMSGEEIDVLLQKVLKELGNSRNLIHQNFLDKDWNGLRALCHRMSGSLGSVGCDILCQHLQIIESKLNSPPLIKPTSTDIADVSRLIDETGNELLKLIKKT